jgi:transposase
MRPIMLLLDKMMQRLTNLSISKNADYIYSHLIATDHILYKIKKLLDFSFILNIIEHCYHPNNGRPAISAELYFKMLLVGYLFNIKSNRRLVEEIKYNILYRWFCDLELEDKIPHHATLSRTRKRFGVDVFEQIFHKILDICRKHELLVAESSVMTDSTLFQANASLDSLKPKENIEIPHDIKKSFSNKTHVSKTDPDASFAFKAGTVRSLKYKAHVTTDTPSRIILAIKITTGGVHDSIPYLEQLEYVIRKSKTNLTEAIADKAYGTGDIIIKPLLLTESSSRKQFYLFKIRPH